MRKTNYIKRVGVISFLLVICLFFLISCDDFEPENESSSENETSQDHEDEKESSDDDNSAVEETNEFIATISGIVWYDSDEDASFSPQEPGLVDITVILKDSSGKELASTMTDDNGYYSFTESLFWDNYSVEVISGLPSEMKQSAPEGKIDNCSSVFSLNAGETRSDVDLGFVPYGGTARVVSRIWLDVDSDAFQDSDEPGLGGYTVKLTDCLGGSQTAITASNGYYRFSSLVAWENYSIEVISGETGLVQTYPANHDDNRVDFFTLNTDQLYQDADIGYSGHPGTAAIHGHVYSDFNQDSIYDFEEPGITGIQVYLYSDVDGDLVFEPGADDGYAIANTLTGSDGRYFFTDVMASGIEDYFVWVNDTQSSLDFYNPVAADPIYIENMDMGDVTASLNFPFVVKESATVCFIKDRIWNDVNGDLADDGESGLSGILAVLFNQSGQVISSVESTLNGYIQFSGLVGDGASYRIAIVDVNDKLDGFTACTPAALSGERVIENLFSVWDHTINGFEPSFGYQLMESSEL